MYDEPDNEAFINIIKSVALDITGESEGHLRKNPMLNLTLNFSDLGNALGNWLLFMKFSLQAYLSIAKFITNYDLSKLLFFFFLFNSIHQSNRNGFTPN